MTDSCFIVTFLGFIILSFLDVLFCAFLWKEKKLVIRPVLCILLWIVVSNITLNEVLRSRRNYWSTFSHDTKLGWYPRKNLKHERMFDRKKKAFYIDTDNFGHRSELACKSNSIIPVMVQGDSNTFGYGLDLESTLCAQLNKLDQSCSNRFYNCGVSGFDINHFYFQYKRLASTFEIKKRLIIFNIDNDFTLSALKTPYYIRRPYLKVENNMALEITDNISPFPMQGFDNEFIEPYTNFNYLIHEPSQGWANNYSPSLLKIPLCACIIGKLHSRLYYFLQIKPDNELARTIYKPLWIMNEPVAWPQPYQDFSGKLGILLRKLKSQNNDLTICLLPMREQIVMAASGQPEKAFSFNKYMVDICEHEDIKLIDPCLAFVQTENPLALFQDDDEHLSSAGIAILAEKIKEYL